MNRLAEIVVQRKAITTILVVFVLLSTTYSVVTPIFEAPDELQHYFFVQHLADGERLPVITGPVPDIQAEVHQPPLYYALGALATFWIDTGPLTDFVWRNPHAQIGVPTASGNVNMVVHSAEESFPYQGVTLAVHLVRWLSVLMGAATVLITYCIAQQVMPRRKELAIGAAVINAFNPQFAFISGTINNDNLMTVLFALAGLLLVVLAKKEVTRGRLILLGLVIGLASLTKLTGLILLPLTAAVLGAVSLRRRRLPPFLGWMAIVSIVALTVGGWWYARNWLLYGDPFGMTIMPILFRTRVYRPSLLELLTEFKGLRMSFWALFGWFNILAEPWLYLAFDGLILLGVVGLLLLVFKQLRGEKTLGWPWLLFLLLWIAVVLAGLVRWTQMTRASQGRLMYPAISAISILLFTGLAQWVSRRAVMPLAGVLGVIMLAIAVVSPFRYIAPAYSRPPLLSKTELDKIPNPMSIAFDSQMKLLGYEVESEHRLSAALSPVLSAVEGLSKGSKAYRNQAGQEAVRPGESLDVTLYWQALAPMERNYSVFVHLLDEDDLVLASQDTFPGQGTYPTRMWRAGDAIADVYTIVIPPTAFTPSSAQLEVGLYEFESGKRLAVYGPQGEPLGDNVRFYRIEVLPHESSAPSTGSERSVPNPVRFNFGGQIALIGYAMERRAIRPGEEIHLTLYWEALAEMERDYTVFTHVIGERDRIWAQVDSQPQGGAAPTSTWSQGQILTDEYHLLVESDTPPGVYDIEVGFYLAATGERLGLLDEAGNWMDSRVLLTKVRVR